MQYGAVCSVIESPRLLRWNSSEQVALITSPQDSNEEGDGANGPQHSVLKSMAHAKIE